MSSSDRVLGRIWQLFVLLTVLCILPSAVFAGVYASPTSSTGTHTISWTAVSGVTDYKINRSFNGTFVNTVFLSATSKVFTEAQSGTYTYAIIALKEKLMPSGEVITTPTAVGSIDVPVAIPLAIPGMPPSISNPGSNTSGSVSVSWGVATGTVSRYELYEKVNSGAYTRVYSGSATSTTLTGRADASYSYQVLACNASGCSSARTTTTTTLVRKLPGVPGTPTNPASSADGLFTISWAASSGTVTYYEFQEKVGSGGWSTIYSGSGRSVSPPSYAEGTYSFRVVACNSYSWSCSTSATTQTVVNYPDTGAVANPPATNTGSVVTVSWGETFPAFSLKESPTGRVWQIIGNASSYPITAPSADGDNYRYSVASCRVIKEPGSSTEISKCGDYGPQGSAMVVRRKPSAAAAPTVSSTTSTTGSVNLSWSKPAGTVTKYYVQKSLNGSSIWQNDGAATTATNKSVSGLSQGNWKFRIRACNDFDWSCSDGSASAELKVRTIPAAPGAPTLSASESNGSINLDWLDVSNASYYDVQTQSGAQVATGVASSAAALTLLADGDWQFKVRACNEYSWACSGYGSLSANLVVRIKPGNPGLPDNPATSNSGIYDIGWTASSGATTYYQVQESSNGGSNWLTIFNDTSLTRTTSVNHAVEGTYLYRVIACNEFSWACTTGATSQTVVSFTPPAGAPVAPEKNAGTQFTVTWPTVWGNGWWLTEHPTNRSWHGQGGNSYSVSPPADGTYTYTIAGCLVLEGDGGDYNCRTESTHSNPLEVRRPPVLQGEMSLAANTASGDITVSWPQATPNADNYRITEVSSGITQTLAGSNLNAIFSARENGDHVYRYQACNYLDYCSAMSDEQSANLLLVPKMQGSLTLPSSNNSGVYSMSWAAANSQVDNYQVREQGGATLGDWVDLGKVLSFSPTSAKPDGTFSYEVRACNASGCAVLPLQASVVVFHPPAQPPVNLVAATSGHSRYVRLDWQSSGDGFDDYYEYRIDGGAWQATTNDRYTVAALPGSGEYTLEVRACNSIPGGVKCSEEPAQIASGLVTIPQRWVEDMPFGAELTDSVFAPLTPAYHDESVGAVAGSGGVDGGAANYNIPLQLPPGRAGMAPSISVGYSSRAGSGVLGMGWQLNVGSAVTRCAQTLVHDGRSLSVQLDQSVDRLCLDGERLLLISGQYGSSNSIYSPESNPLVKVVQQGSLDAEPTFTVTSANGHTRYYGTRANSAMVLAGLTRALSWSISHEQDLAGNTVNYFYESYGSGEYHLSEIWYTGTDANSGDRKVEFIYGPAEEADVSSQYLVGGLTRQTQRLKRIDVSLAGELLREYRFDYHPSRASGRSLMDSVEECALSGGQYRCLEKTRLSWADAKPSFVLEKVGYREPGATDNYLENDGADLNPQLQAQRFIDDIAPQGDVDGNGVSDWNSASATESQSQLAFTGWHTNAEGFKTRDNLNHQQVCQFNSLSYRRVCTGADFNLDGKTDNWRAVGNYFELAYDFDVGGQPIWFSTPIPSRRDAASELNDRIETIGDFNGDGYPDLVIRSDVKLQAKASLHLHLHSGNSANPYSATGQLIYTFRTVDLAPNPDQITSTVQFVGDLDGNGLPDFVDASNQMLVAGNYTSSPQPTPYKFYLTQVNAQGQVSFDTVDLTAQRQARVDLAGGIANLDLHFNFFMDVNADGLTDWLSWVDRDMAVALNQGGSFGPWQLVQGTTDLLATREFPYVKRTEGWDSTQIPKYAASFKLMDTNADGRTELLMPGNRVVTNCQFVYDKAVKGPKCGDALYDPYGVDEYGNNLSIYPVDELDESLYSYKALNIIEQADGSFRAELKPTGIVASATQVAVVDVFGNGLNDVVFAYGCRNETGCLWTDSWDGHDFGTYVYRNRGSAEGNERYEPTDMLMAVENGLGVRDQWAYRPLSSQDSRYHSDDKPFYERGGYLDSLSADVRADHFEFTSSMYVVARHEQSDGVGGLNAQEYRYKGAVFNHRGRGFQGFHTIIAENLSAGLETQSDFHQIYPLAGKLFKVRQWSLEDRSTDDSAIDAMDETSVVWQLWPKGNLGQRVTVAALTDQWTLAANSLGFVSLESQVQQLRSLAANGNLRDLLYTQSQNQTIDEWGNITLASQTYAEPYGANTVRQETETNYAPDEGNWWFNKPVQQQVRRFAVQNRSGTPIEDGTDSDASVTVEYLAWNTDLRLPTHVLTTPSTGKASELFTGDFDSFGQPRQVTARAAGETDRVTRSQYSSDGYFVETVINPLGHTATSQMLAAHGQPDWVEDANGNRTHFGYDAHGRRTWVQVPGQPKAYTRLQWCGLGQCDNAPQARYKATQQQAGAPALVSYVDLLGRPIRSEVEAFSGYEWLVSEVTYNALGQKTFESQPDFNAPSSFGTRYLSYDKRGRLLHKQVDQTDGKVLDTHYTHEQGDQGFTTNINASGLSMARTYNGLNQLVQTVDAKDGMTAYAYDGAGNPIVLHDANGNRITAAHNALGQKLWVNDPNMGQKSFTYTGFGELDTETDANGNVTDLNYDKLGRVTQRWVNGTQEAGWTFDTAAHGIGLPASEQRLDASYSRSYQYDALSRPDTVTTVIDGQSFAVRSHYDANYGRVKGLQYPNGLTLAYGYTDSGYAQTVSNAASGYVYRQIEDQDASGQWREARMADRLLTVQRGFDAATGQLRYAQLDDPMGKVHRQDYVQFDVFGNLKNMTTEIPSHAKYYDANNNLLPLYQNEAKITDALVSEEYFYDDLHRLTANDRSNGAKINYSYDAVGNLLLKSDFASLYRYDGAKPNAVSGVDLVAGGSISYGYDNNGNRTHENGVQTVTYNAFNKPTQITRNGTTVSFSYGADQMRYKQVKGGKTTLYIDKLFEKTTSSSGTDYRLFIEDIAVLTTQVDASNNTTHKIAFTHRDRLGSTVAISDHLGVLKETQSYDPFGKPRAGDLTDLLNAIVDSSWTTRGFTDHEHLDEVKLIHMNGRGYDYELGRFLSVDPVIQAPGNSQSLNPYSYVMNNPLAGVDPTGYTAEPVKKVFKVAVTGSRIKHKVTATVTQKDGKTEISLEGGNGAAQKQVAGNIAGALSQFAPKGGAGGAAADIGGLSQNATDFNPVKSQESNPFQSSDSGRLDLAANDGFDLGGVFGLQGQSSPDPGYSFREFGSLWSAEQTEAQVEGMLVESTIFVASGLAGETLSLIRFGRAAVTKGLSQNGLAYQLKHLNKHLPGTPQAEKLIRKEGAAHVFTDKATLSRVEKALFERGQHTGNLRGADRYGLMFEKPIGYRISSDGSKIPLHYGEMKVKDGFYHIIPRTGPGK